MRFKKPKIQLKRILTFTISLAVIAAIFFRLSSQSVEAAWFDDAYAFRVKFSFTHNANITDPRSVTYTLDTAELITANLMQSDCDDIRFADASGKALLYDLTGTCNNAATTFEVIFPNITNGTNVAYAYYSNATASNAEINSAGFTTLTPSGGDPSDTNPTAADEKGPTPLIYYKFDENGGTTAYDSSPSKNNAVIDSSSYWYSNDMCVSGSCLFFPGSSNRVTKTYSADTELNPGTDSFTVSVWAKRTRAATDTDYIVSRESTGGYNIYMNSSANLCFEIVSGANTDTACTSTTYNDSQWHYITAVKNGTTDIRLYIDGTQMAIDSSIIATGSISGSSPDLSIGRNTNGSTAGEWIGFIDEVKFYNFAKSASQINAEFASKSQNKGSSATIGSSPTKNSISNGLVSYWKTDEGSGSSANDSSGNGYTGTITNSPTWTTGKYEYAPTYTAASSQYININTSASKIASGNVSISAWFRPTSTFSSANTTDQYIYALSSSTSLNDVRLVLRESDGKLKFGIHDGSVINYAESTTTSWTSGVWYHVTATFSSSEGLKLYINGNLEGTNSSKVRSSTDPSSEAYIAAYYSGSYFSGIIDEVRIYNRSLSASESKTVYEYAPGPSAYWKFDEGAGTSTYDSSGNNSTGTLNSSTVVWRPGKFGSAFHATSGTDRIELGIPSYTNDIFINHGTVSAWIYTMVSDSVARRIIDKGIWQFDTQGSSGSFVALDFCYGFSTQSGCWITGEVIPLNTWVHVAVTYNNSSTANDPIMYINGVRQSITETLLPTGSVISDSSNNLFLGNNTGGTRSRQGPVDEIKMYRYGRTQKQIIEDMNGGHPAVGTPVGSYIGYWNLDESTSTTAYDKSSNSNNLTLSTASWTLSGKKNAAWNGTGSNPYLSRSDDPDFDFLSNEDFTLSIWARSDSDSNPAASQFLIDKQVATNNPGYRLYFNTSGQVVCDIDDDTTSYPEDSATTTSDYYDATWHHIVCIRDITKDRLLIFIDGKLIAQDTDLSATGDLSNTDTLTIGAQDTTDAGTDDFAGDLDEIKIYRLALSESDVLVEYNNASSASFGNLGTNLSPTPQADNSLARSFCPPGDTGTCNSPTAWYKLDDNFGTNAIDSSGNGNIAALVTNPNYVQGKIGQGLNLNGTNQYIDTNANLIDETSAYTISMWIYPRTTNADEFIMGSEGGEDNSVYFGATNDLVYCGDGVCANTASTSTNAFTTNAWQHLVITYTGTASNGTRFYVNGVDVTSDATTVETNNTGNTYFGSYAVGSYNRFDGVMDDIRIYNYVRSQSQIAWDYNLGSSTARYKFDECQGSTLYDTSLKPNPTSSRLDATITIGASGSETSIGDCTTSSTAWGNGTTGKYSSSLDFDGTDDYAEISSTVLTSLGPTSNFSLSAWIKPGSAQSGFGDRNQAIGNIVAANQFEAEISLPYSGTNKIAIEVGQAGVGSQSAESSQTYSTDTWYHVVGVFRGSSSAADLYVNGKYETTMNYDATTTSADAADSGFSIGAQKYDGSWYYHFDGSIDEVQIYNYPLTSTQVKSIYNQGSSVRFGPETGTP